jgi:hypothetical protein
MFPALLTAPSFLRSGVVTSFFLTGIDCQSESCSREVDMSETAREPDLAVDPKIWNHHPVVPIRSGGVFRNLLNPFAVIKGKLLS